MQPHHSQSAFSLVELSIVLVILGLLTGGILGGQALIRAAELRSVSTDLAKYRTAVFSFRDKYFALPGDMTNATSVWGNASTGAVGGECAAPEVDGGTGTLTCNGNGNGQIGRATSTATNNSESFRFWQQLANAGFVEGQYSGLAADLPAGGTGWRVAVPGTNIPRLRFGNAGISVAAHAASWNGTGGADSWTGGDSGAMKNYAYFGAPTTGDLTWGPIFRPEELWNIDTKNDDGRPGAGIVRSHAAINCTTSNDSVASNYSLTTSTVACTGLIDLGI